jgi:hypothetical protein
MRDLPGDESDERRRGDRGIETHDGEIRGWGDGGDAKRKMAGWGDAERGRSIK